jgi:hypothetical protein
VADKPNEQGGGLFLGSFVPQGKMRPSTDRSGQFKILA